jgi:hypothetical protein
MDEFNNRMDAQRNVLEIVNRQVGNKEELCGLSKKTIERWITANRLNPEGEICKILFKISEKLSFLATKSQEQISEEYRLISSEISKLKLDLEKVS